MNVAKGMGMGMPAGQISEDDIFSGDNIGDDMQEGVKDEDYYKGKLQEVLDTLEAGDVEKAKAIIMECLSGDLAEEDYEEQEDPALSSIFGGQ